MSLRRQFALSVLVAALFAPTLADARPTTRKASDPKKLGAVARVAFGRDMRPTREVVGRRTDPLTDEEDTAARIQQLLRGPLLRRGVTGLYVVNAKTGDPLFAVNADDPLNPASNVKMISTATALELLGPAFRYPTRVLGPQPAAGAIKGDVYLLGSHDPTLAFGDFDGLAASIAARGITRIDGSVITGADDTRDGIYRATVPIAITAGDIGKPAVVTPPKGLELVTIKNTAVTSRIPNLKRLTYKLEEKLDAGVPHFTLTVGGVIGVGAKVDYPLPATKYRTAVAGHALLAALKSHGITVSGSWKTLELGDFVGDAVARGGLPIELGRHESAPVAEIVQTINKWSINWLADRLVMTAAGIARRKPPSMELAVDAMYSWLDRHPHVGKKSCLVDTGSGLSYKTQISPHELVSIARSAGGFAGDTDPAAARAWLQSLSVGGVDGTLRYRFRDQNLGGHLIGKTGTLSTVIALSGVLDVDPQRPLVFALVTNTDVELSKPIVRKAHEQVVGELVRYLGKTSRAPLKVAPVPVPKVAPAGDAGEEPPDHDPALDNETVDKK